MTKTLSQSMTVGILWAMLIIVRSAKSSRMIFCITASVCESTDAVASSMNSILLRFSMILPKHRSCLCPTLQLSPPSTTNKLNQVHCVSSYFHQEQHHEAIINISVRIFYERSWHLKPQVSQTLQPPLLSVGNVLGSAATQLNS